MSDKYTGNFLERLISVVERVMGGGDATEPNDASEKQPEATTRVYPTDAERREAWVRENGPDEGEGDE